MALHRPLVAVVSFTLGSTAVTALADPEFSMHVEAAAAHAVGEEKIDQFGWGGTGAVVPELALHEVFGLELAVGAMVMSDGGSEPAEPGVAPTDVGVAGFSTVGPRVRPLATVAERTGVFDLDGFWLAAGVGAALTGDAIRPTLRTALGWDAMSDIFSAGPFVGFQQVVEPDDASLRPEDARIAVIGLSGTFAPPTRHAVDPAQPAPDADGDGIPDRTDACESEPEDKDRWSDLDGCPEPDNDKDGLLDKADRCPNQAEDLDGKYDDDGCPDVDDDGDGVLEGKDQCPYEKEDADGFEDADGCPDPDNDKDGVADASDACPEEQETRNEIRDTDGCPDTKDLHVTGSHIVLDEVVHFASDSAVITDDASVALLARVAEFLALHPEYACIQVAGHADRSGTDDYNMKLSTARALSVRDSLVRKGVPVARFRIAAFGNNRPRERGDAKDAQAENRRVEFEILERAKKESK